MFSRFRSALDDNVDVAFGRALGVAGYDTNNPDHQDLARAAMTSLRTQQRLIVNALTQHETLFPELWHPIEQANAVLSTMANFGTQLRSYPQFTSSEYVLALGWAANVLPRTVGSPNMAQVSEVLSDIVALKSRLAGLRFPPELYSFMEHLLKDLEQNIVEASFEGATSIDRAYRRARAEVDTASDVLRRSSSSDLNDEQVDFLHQAAEKIDQVGKITGGLSSVIDFAQKFIPLLG